jgi:hypothetical protein
MKLRGASMPVKKITGCDHGYQSQVNLCYTHSDILKN